MTDQPQKPRIGETLQFRPPTATDSEGNDVELFDVPKQVELEGERYRIRAVVSDGKVMTSVGKASARVDIPDDNLDRFVALVADELVTSLRNEHHKNDEFWSHWKHDLRYELRDGDRFFLPPEHRVNHPDLADEDRVRAQIDKMCGFLAELGREYEIRDVDDGVRAVVVMGVGDG